MLLLGLLEVPVWLATCLVLVFAMCSYSWYKQNLFKRLGIRTKPTLLLLGDIPTLFKTGFGYIDYDLVKQNGKVFGIFIGNQPSLVVQDIDILKEVLVKRFSSFSNRTLFFRVQKEWYSGMTIAKDAHWKFLRSTLSPTFSAGKLRQMCPLIHRCLDNLEEFLDEKIQEHPEGFDMLSILSGVTMDVIVTTSFGMDINALRNQDTQFVKTLHKIVNFSPANLVLMLLLLFPDLSDWLPHVAVLPKDQYNYMKTVLLEVFEERKKETSNKKDLVQQMINAHKENPAPEDQEEGNEDTIESFKRRGLTDDEILTNSLIFMGAGFDTTASTLSWMLYDLVTNPDWMSKIVTEIDEGLNGDIPTYDNVNKLPNLNMVFKETLRMHPPATRANRQCKEDVEIKGVRIPKGMDVVFSPLALHYDPEHWPNPHKFDPLRFSPENEHLINEFAYMPFGMGPRNCVGMRLAILEVKVVLTFLLQKFTLQRTDQLTVPMPSRRFNIMKPGKPLHLKVTRRFLTTK